MDLITTSEGANVPLQWHKTCVFPEVLVSRELRSALHCQRWVSLIFGPQQQWIKVKIFLRTALRSRMYTQGSRIWFQVAIRITVSRVREVGSCLVLALSTITWIWQNNGNSEKLLKNYSCRDDSSVQYRMLFSEAVIINHSKQTLISKCLINRFHDSHLTLHISLRYANVSLVYYCDVSLWQ